MIMEKRTPGKEGTNYRSGCGSNHTRECTDRAESLSPKAQELPPGFLPEFPDDDGPPPFFESFGSGSEGAGLPGGAGASLTSVPSLQPTVNVATKAVSVNRLRMLRRRINKFLCLGGAKRTLEAADPTRQTTRNRTPADSISKSTLDKYEWVIGEDRLG